MTTTIERLEAKFPETAWHENDTRGYTDPGPSCDDCGACECDPCEECGMSPGCSCDVHNPEHECCGLSVAYVRLDGGEAYCEECIEKILGEEG